MENNITTPPTTTKKTTSFCTKVKNFFAILFCCFWVKKATPVTPTMAEASDLNRTSTTPLNTRSLSAETTTESTLQATDSTTAKKVARPLTEMAYEAVCFLEVALEALAENRSGNNILALLSKANIQIRTIYGPNGEGHNRSRVEFYNEFIRELLQQNDNLRQGLVRAIKDNNCVTYKHLVLINHLQTTPQDFPTPEAATLLQGCSIFVDQLLSILSDDCGITDNIEEIIASRGDQDSLDSFKSLLKDASEHIPSEKKEDPPRSFSSRLMDKIKSFGPFR